MKILHVVSGFAPAWGLGGAVKVSYDLTKSLAQNGHQVDVYTTDMLTNNLPYCPKQIPENREGVNVYHFKNFSYRLAIQYNIPYSQKMISALKRNISKYDIVHIHEYRTINGSAAMYYANKNNIPYIVQPHGSLPVYNSKKSLKMVFDKIMGHKYLYHASKLLALNSRELNQFKEIGINHSKIVVVPNGININFDINNFKQNSFRDKYGISSDAKVILFLGRIHWIKGLDLLIEAFSKLYNDDNKIKLVIIGPDKGFLEKIKKDIEGFNIQDNVIITGPLYDVDKYEAYLDADLYVLPSRYETFPITVLESLHCDTPVIITKNCGIAEKISESGAGVVVNFDIDELKTSINKILFNSDFSNNLITNGNNLLLNDYNYENVVKQVLSIYLETIES